jgi:hypothetical protein
MHRWNALEKTFPTKPHIMGYVLHMYMTFDRGPEGTVGFQYKNKLEPTYDRISHMPKTAFENIEPFKSYKRGTDRHTRHSHKGVSPLKN